MKKTFVTVSLIVALAAAANATSFERDNVVATSQAETAEMQSEVQSDEDIYRTHAMQSEEADKHIIRFYDIDRIVIKNDNHALIRIYDDKWQLIEKTRDNVDKGVRAGNYYVTCSRRMRSNYEHTNH